MSARPQRLDRSIRGAVGGRRHNRKGDRPARPM